MPRRNMLRLGDAAIGTDLHRHASRHDFPTKIAVSLRKTSRWTTASDWSQQNLARACRLAHVQPTFECRRRQSAEGTALQMSIRQPPRSRCASSVITVAPLPAGAEMTACRVRPDVAPMQLSPREGDDQENEEADLQLMAA